jgi:hypothetical protein
MATYEKKILSASTDGRPILVVNTASSGTTIHTGSATATTLQEVWLYASNPNNTQYTLTVQFGGTTAINDDIVIPIPPQTGLVLISPGLILKGNATPLVIRAYASTASKITITGYVNEIV